MNACGTYRRGMARAVPLLFVLIGCTNDPQVVKEVVNEYDGPLRTQENVSYTYTDSGRVEMVFDAVEAIDYSHLEEEPYMEFPKGVYVTFYNDTGAIENTLKANYAINYIDEARWEAQGDVEVNTIKKEQLNTEHLIWDQESQRIRSEKRVKITTPESIIWGMGFDADQNMRDYEIKDVTGTIYFDESKTDSTDTPGI